MPNSTVSFSKLFDGVLMETKMEYAKKLSSVILDITGYKNQVNIANSISGNFQVSVAMYDFGNLSGLKKSALQMAMKLATMTFFIKHSIYLRIADIFTSVDGSTVG